MAGTEPGMCECGCGPSEPPLVTVANYGYPDDRERLLEVLAHPYQQGRHGAPRKAPAGLDAAERRDWYRRYDEGAVSFDIFSSWVPRGDGGDALRVEWERNRAVLGLT